MKIFFTIDHTFSRNSLVIRSSYQVSSRLLFSFFSFVDVDVDAAFFFLFSFSIVVLFSSISFFLFSFSISFHCLSISFLLFSFSLSTISFFFSSTLSFFAFSNLDNFRVKHFEIRKMKKCDQLIKFWNKVFRILTTMIDLFNIWDFDSSLLYLFSKSMIECLKHSNILEMKNKISSFVERKQSRCYELCFIRVFDIDSNERNRAIEIKKSKRSTTLLRLNFLM